MRTEDQGDEPSYEVGQEQLDAVDRMLEELDLVEHFDRVPAAFRIVERFEQQQHQQDHVSRLNSQSNRDVINSHRDVQDMEMGDADHDHRSGDREDGSDDEDSPEPFGYIPLDQGDFNDNEDDDDEDAGYAQMQSDGEEDGRVNDDEEEEGQGYDGYLHSTNLAGAIPVPIIPQAVHIELEEVDERAAEGIPEEDLKTIAMVMSSFSLPAPDWARSIPEERWLPKIVQQAETTSTLSGAGATTAFEAVSVGAMTTTSSVATNQDEEVPT